MQLSIRSFEKTRTFTVCFGIEAPLQRCGSELKSKLHDLFKPFSTSYHVLLENRVPEVIFINYFMSYTQSSNTFTQEFNISGVFEFFSMKIKLKSAQNQLQGCQIFQESIQMSHKGMRALQIIPRINILLDQINIREKI